AQVIFPFKINGPAIGIQCRRFPYRPGSNNRYIPGLKRCESRACVSGVVGDLEYYLIRLFLDMVAGGVPLELQFIWRIGGPEIRYRTKSGRGSCRREIEYFGERFDFDGMVFRIHSKNRF